MKAPINRIKEIISTHDYKGIIVRKHDKDEYIVASKNELPGVLYSFIHENYNVITYAAEMLIYHEYDHIGVETYFNELMIF